MGCALGPQNVGAVHLFVSLWVPIRGWAAHKGALFEWCTNHVLGDAVSLPVSVRFWIVRDTKRGWGGENVGCVWLMEGCMSLCMRLCVVHRVEAGASMTTAVWPGTPPTTGPRLALPCKPCPDGRAGRIRHTPISCQSNVKGNHIISFA